MHDWLLTSSDAVAAIVPSGAKLAVGTDDAGAPMELTRALVRAGVRDLHLVCVPTSGLPADLLIGAGCVATLETSAITFGEHGTPHRFQDAVRREAIRLLDSTCPAVLAALEAGRKDIPFIPLRGLIGSDLVKVRPDWRVIDNPFLEGDPIIVLPAIRPDFALLHAPWADRHGNVFLGRRRELVTMVQASTGGALVTVEEVRDCDLMASEEGAAGALPALYVRGAAVAPRGAWPLNLWDLYEIDADHMLLYGEASRSPEGFGAYLGSYVLGAGARSGAPARSPEAAPA